MTIDVAPETATSTTQLPDPLTIDFVSALFTSRNRAAKFLHKQYALTDFVHSLAKWLEKQKTQDILADIPAIATTDPVDETTIAAQIIQLLTLHLYGEQATLDAARLGNSLVDHHRRTILNHEEQYRWYFSQNPAVPSHLSSQEDCVAWNLWLGLARLFGMNTVEKCTQRLWLHHASYAPLIAAAPIELIELWLAVPSARPSVDELRLAASDGLAQDPTLTVAAGIYRNFAPTFEQLNNEDREHVAAILRRYTQKFAGHARSPLTGCSHAMHLTLCDLLNEAQFTYLFHFGSGSKNYLPMALAFQIIFLAFYNASMMVPEDCRLPRGTEDLADLTLLECQVCGTTLRTRPTGKDTSETYCSFCEQDERKERACQQEHEEQMLGLAPRQIMRPGKTARERGRVTALRRKFSSDSVSTITPIDAILLFIDGERERKEPAQITLTIKRFSCFNPTLTVSLALPEDRGTIWSDIFLTTFSGERERSPEIRRKLSCIKLLGEYSRGEREREKVTYTILPGRSKQLDFFLDACKIVPVRHKNRPAGMRLSHKERREEYGSFADPGERYDTTEMRRDARRGHRHGFKPLNPAHEGRRERELQKDFDLRTAFLPYIWSPRKVERLSPSSNNEVERLANKYGEYLPPTKKPNRSTRARQALADRARRFN
jgi:hypothetical protein